MFFVLSLSIFFLMIIMTMAHCRSSPTIHCNYKNKFAGSQGHQGKNGMVANAPSPAAAAKTNKHQPLLDKGGCFLFGRDFYILLYMILHLCVHLLFFFFLFV